jgi:hypothetical protein
VSLSVQKMKKANAGNITIPVALLKDKNKKNEP